MVWFKKTPENELAARVRSAAEEYNKAARAAKAGGLDITTYSNHIEWCGSKEYHGFNRLIIVDRIERTKTEKF